jgi:DNA replication licensing factor MCM7
VAEGFEDFLSHFKLSGEAALAHQMGGISIEQEEEDDLSDEYDFMDDEDPQARAREKAAQRGPIHKYVEVMQLVADRKQDEIVVDLDDLASVSFSDGG